ncbi:hypothetical protein G6F68_009794 [Rhizopus microsporus]|nr:hypothetical protein G6F68_009794 [Rhizopus microsporus]
MPLCVLDHDRHQPPADAVALQVRPDQDAVLATVVIGVGVQAHRAEHFAAARFNRHQCDRARVVELGQARDEFVAEVLHRLEEAQAQVLVADTGEERAEQRVVFRPHRPYEGAAAVGQVDGALPLLRIREHRETRMAAALVQDARGRDGDARIQGEDALAIDQQWIDVQPPVHARRRPARHRRP